MCIGGEGDVIRRFIWLYGRGINSFLMGRSLYGIERGAKSIEHLLLNI